MDEIQPILFPLEKAAAKLGLSKKKLEHLAGIQDLAHLEIDGELYFRLEALQEWVVRNTSKVW
jgi:hypothetical protein